jgi:hypothetical protein
LGRILRKLCDAGGKLLGRSRRAHQQSLTRYGADRFAYFVEPKGAVVIFEVHGRLRFNLPLVAQTKHSAFLMHISVPAQQKRLLRVPEQVAGAESGTPIVCSADQAGEGQT